MPSRFPASISRFRPKDVPAYHRDPRPAPWVGWRANAGLPPGDRAKPGLSKSHIRPQTVLQAWKGGSLLRLKAFVGQEQPDIDKKPREAIDEFSSKSRHRMRLMLSTIKRGERCFTFCMTYPEQFSEDDRVWKRDLATWLKRLRRQYPDVSVVWKLEFQKRGAPHFHLLLWGIPADSWMSDRAKANPDNMAKLPSYSEFHAFAAEAWHELVGMEDPAHLRWHMRVPSGPYKGTFDMIQKPGRFVSYVAGYVSKDDQTKPGSKVGRYWGVHNRKCLPVGEVQEQPLYRDDYNALRRMALRHKRSVQMAAFRKARAKGKKVRKPRQLNNMSVALICDVDHWLTKIPAIMECRRWWVRSSNPSLAKTDPALRPSVAERLSRMYAAPVARPYPLP